MCNLATSWNPHQLSSCPATVASFTITALSAVRLTVTLFSLPATRPRAALSGVMPRRAPLVQQALVHRRRRSRTTAGWRAAHTVEAEAGAAVELVLEVLAAREGEGDRRERDHGAQAEHDHLAVV